MQYILWASYEITDQNGSTRIGKYVGREEGVGITFNVFQTKDHLPGQAGFVRVLIPVGEEN